MNHLIDLCKKKLDTDKLGEGYNGQVVGINIGKYKMACKT